jgi:hypothetical protein
MIWNKDKLKFKKRHFDGDLLLREQITKNITRLKSKGLDDDLIEYHLLDMIDITIEFVNNLKKREYLRFFDEKGEGMMWTKHFTKLERGVCRNLFTWVTLGLFLKKLKFSHGDNVDNYIDLVNDYMNRLFFQGKNIFITFLDVTDSITPSELEEKSHISELVKMWNSRIFNQRLCSITPEIKQLYNKLDESLMLMWYLDFMVKISKDTDEMVSDFESKENFEKYFL